MAEVHAGLQRVQVALKAPKNQYNSFGKYKYRSCEDILEAVKPLLAENGLVMTITDDINVPEGAAELLSGRDGADKRPSPLFVRSIVTVTAISDGSCVSNQALARLDDSKKGMDGAQLTGAASSYARKYALNGMFLIDDTKDADATNDHGRGTAQKAPKTAQKAPRKAKEAPARAATAPEGAGEAPEESPEGEAIGEGQLREMRETFSRYCDVVGTDGRGGMALVLDGTGVKSMGKGNTPDEWRKIMTFMSARIVDSVFEG